jgi:hypothetical protein
MKTIFEHEEKIWCMMQRWWQPERQPTGLFIPSCLGGLLATEHHAAGMLSVSPCSVLMHAVSASPLAVCA